MEAERNEEHEARTKITIQLERLILIAYIAGGTMIVFS
jgi:hypothetical protein